MPTKLFAGVYVISPVAIFTDVEPLEGGVITVTEAGFNEHPDTLIQPSLARVANVTAVFLNVVAKSTFAIGCAEGSTKSVTVMAVSYTHLDVYKRQDMNCI